MRIARRLLLPGIAVAAAALLTAGAYQPADQDSGVALTAASQVVVNPTTAPVTTIPTADQLAQVLAPASAFPAGTTLNRSTVADAAAAGLFKPPSTVVVSPAACTNLLGAAVGDVSRLTGWVESGTEPDGSRADNAVLAAPGGINLAALKANVAACKNGTVSVPSLGLTGTITLTEFAASTVPGAQAVGVQQKVTFSQKTEVAAQLAAAGSSAQVYAQQGSVLSSVCLIRWLESSAVSQTVQQQVVDGGLAVG